jgi:hypothetical protein
MMTAKLSSTSRSTEARKYLHDTEVRYRAPLPEIIRPKPPALSKSFRLIFVVTAYRSADGARDHHRAIGPVWRCDEETGYSRANGYPELTLASKSLNGPDPRLIEFVRLLARHAAAEFYGKLIEERPPKRS